MVVLFPYSKVHAAEPHWLVGGSQPLVEEKRGQKTHCKTSPVVSDLIDEVCLDVPEVATTCVRSQPSVSLKSAVGRESVGSLVRRDGAVCESVVGSCHRCNRGPEVVVKRRVWVMGYRVCQRVAVMIRSYGICPIELSYLPYRPLGEDKRSRFGAGDAASRRSMGVASRLLFGGREFRSLSLLGEGTYLDSPPLRGAGLLALNRSSSRRGE